MIYNKYNCVKMCENRTIECDLLNKICKLCVPLPSTLNAHYSQPDKLSKNIYTVLQNCKYI